MASRANIAIDIDRRCLRAVQAEREGRRIEVKRMIVEPVPETVDGDDPDALGAWMRGRLEAARIPRERATFAITREDVALKRMAMPTTDETELPEMTRLALRRELPFDADGAVIDFVSLERRERTTVVMAAAVPREVLEFTRRVARAAGFGVERVSLRTMGSASLLGGMPRPEAGGTLAVDVTSHRVEFSVIVDGQVRFSRACDLPENTEPAGLADARRIGRWLEGR
jgi:type IV pilus assembly protein PilM